MRSFARFAFIPACFALSLSLSSCGTSKTTNAGSDPLTDLRNENRAPRHRVAMVDAARAKAQGDPQLLAATIQTYKDIAWSPRENPELRLAVVTAMFNDPDPKVIEDARAMAKLMLPRERERAMVVYISKTAGDRGWTDFIPSLIRSYSRPMKNVEDADRAEAVAIKSLAGGRSLEDEIFSVFMNPPTMPESYGMDWSKRFRADAWDLLGRLDKDGTRRMQLLSGESNKIPAGDAVIADMRRAIKELRTLPVTGEEINWLASLVDESSKQNAAWWRETSSAVKAVESHAPFRMRHLEAIRWSAQNRASWLTLNREQLLAELRVRLDARDMHVRSAGFTNRTNENLEAWADELKWPDVLTILVADDMLQQPDIRASIFEHAKLDRLDTTTEYGGIITAYPTIDKGRARITLYPPRPGQRDGDEKFVASDSMLAASDCAMAHYHMHVQKVRNAAYAGPSDGDLTYAARFGRTCIVFTSVNENEMNADLYQPDGVIIDLGSFKKP